MRYAVALFALLGVGLLAKAPPSEAVASTHNEVLYKAVRKQVWYPAGWYGGVYYASGYYWVTEYVPLAVLKQTYSVSHDVEKGGIIEELKLLREEVRTLKGGAQQLRAVDALALARNECAGCHGARVAAEKGDGFAMFDADGKLASAIGRSAAKRVVSRINSTDAALRMPPGKQLGVEDRAAIKGLMEGLGAAKE